ncbi:MAG: ATP-grasp domain-containing protein [Promethearchaeota archaeon]
MASKLPKIYVGTIVNRDLEVFNEIKHFIKLNYNISFIKLIKNGIFSLKYFQKKIRKYPLSFIIVKLYSEESNQKIYDALQNYAPNIPRLNSAHSVQICESRRATFKLVEEKVKKLTVPNSYFSIKDALKAVSEGIPIIIKLDTHNIRNLSKYDRILGVARTKEDFLDIIKMYDVENNILFFQEYLGKFEIVYKVYVINHYVQTITSQDILRNNKFTPLELIHMRVSIDPNLRRRILRLGKKFRMSIYGVDYVVRDGIPYIVDINDFPSFRNIPEAVSLISNYIHKFITDHKTLTKKPMSLKVKTYTI